MKTNIYYSSYFNVHPCPLPFNSHKTIGSTSTSENPSRHKPSSQDAQQSYGTVKPELHEQTETSHFMFQR